MITEPVEPDLQETFRFHELPAVAFVEIDRYCEGCGYNLRTQAIRRDPRTYVLLTRCPECGRYHPATDATTAARVWLRRLSPLLFLGWVGLVLSAAAILLFGLGGISYATLEELTTWRAPSALATAPASAPATQAGSVLPGLPGITIPTPGGGQTTYVVRVSPGQSSYLRQVREGDEDYHLFMTVVTLGSLALAFVGAVLMVVLFCHWRRGIHLAVMLAAPLAVAAVVLLGWREEAAHLLSWGLGYIGYHTLVQIVGGVLGVALGRLVARGLVRAVVPPSWRGPLAYLWLVDGKVPPDTTEVVGHTT